MIALPVSLSASTNSKYLGWFEPFSRVFFKTKGHSLLRISDASLCSPHQTLISLAIQTSRLHETEGLNGRTMKSPLNKFHSAL